MTAAETEPDEDLDHEARMHAYALRDELRRLRARQDAQTILAAERAGEVDLPPASILDEFLAQPDNPVTYMIDRLWPKGGRVVLSAQYKAGKSTLRDNAVKSLVDGGPFLGVYDVQRPAGRVVVIDNELHEDMLRAWLRSHGISNTPQVAVFSLRGRVHTFDILNPTARAKWAAVIRQIAGEVVLFDCLRPVLDALGLSEDKDAGRFLVAFDALLAEAGAGEGMIIHHMGHANERSRGDSRILDWPDAIWKLVRESAEAEDSPRYFSAIGRDVSIPESRLAYSESTRSLSLNGGSRKHAARDAALAPVGTFIRERPGCSGADIDKHFADADEHKREPVRAAVKFLIAKGHVRKDQGGKHGAHQHFWVQLASSPQLADSSPARLQQLASSPIEGELQAASWDGNHEQNDSASCNTPEDQTT